MTDVRNEAVATARTETRDRGNFIWYELMTTDADGAKAFYDAVVGWNIESAVELPQRLSDGRPQRRQVGRRGPAPDRRDAAAWRPADLARLPLCR